MMRGKHIKRKALLIYLCILTLSLCIVAQIVYTQGFESHIWNPENYNITRLVPVEASRGNIYSSDYSLLATSIPEYEIRWDATLVNSFLFNENIKLLSANISSLFQDKTPLEYEGFFRNQRINQSRYSLVKRKVNYNQLKLMKNFPIFKEGKYTSGFIYHQNNKRKKPFKTLAARTIGYDRKESKSVGLEGAFNLYLKGKEGERLEQRLSGNVWMPIRESEPSPGKDLLTTIDIQFQDIAQRALQDRIIHHNADHGCVVLMEVKTGAIKAIVNLKRTDKGHCIENYNYAIAEASEPGSTFKLASLLAGLEDGYLDILDSIDTESGVFQFYDRKMRDSRKGGYGKISLKEAFEKSSNVGISKLIHQNYRNNPEQFVNRIYSMGLNDPLGISISGETRPNIRHPKDKKSWSGTTLPWMSIGYGVEITPLQTLSFYSAIANEGMRMKPYFVQSILDNGLISKTFSPEIISPSICSNTSIKIAQSMLEGVVESGTAKNIQSLQYRIAGKTGTNWIDYANKLEDDRPKYQASFVGYFPADNPKYSCIVVVNDPKTNGSYGGEVAAPVFKAISDYVFITDLELHQQKILQDISIPKFMAGSAKDLLLVSKELSILVNEKTSNLPSEWVYPSYTDTLVELNSSMIKDNLDNNAMPSIVGMALADAMYVLENYGFKVNVIGKGRITEQSIPQGNSIRKGQEITLKLT